MKAIKQFFLVLLLVLLPASMFGYQLNVQVVPQNGGTASGSGNYESGTEVSVSTSARISSMKFEGWFDAGNNKLSTSSSFKYIMPEHDATLTARYIYSPALPGDPDAPVEPDHSPLYKVDISLASYNSGSVTSSFSDKEGTTRTITASPYSSWLFKEWRDGDNNVVSTTASFTYTVPAHDSKLVAYMTYNPTGPVDPGQASWNPLTGELTVSCITSGLTAAVNTVMTSASYPEVKKLTICDPTFNSTQWNLSLVQKFTSLEEIDMRNTIYSSLGSYDDLTMSTLKKMVLPATITSFSYYTWSSSSCNIEEIYIYATEPPTVGAEYLSRVPNTCIVYVPNESVELYKAAMYWKDKDIRPMIDETAAVGPGEDGWNDITLVHKVPFTYTYNSGNGGSIEYMVEEDGVWHPLASDLTDGQSVDANALASFMRTRRIHTVDFRVVNGENTTPLTDKRVEYTDLAYAKITFGSKLYYDYGNTIEPEMTVEGLTADKYSRAFINNVNAGRATAMIEGLYPYSIGSRSKTFDIAPLPLPGELVLTSTEPIVYDNSTKYPQWAFTDSRNAGISSGNYTINWANNRYAGTATLTVSGKGNFTGALTLNFTIEKSEVLANAYERFTKPDEELLYDGAAHGLNSSYYSSYSGKPIIYYKDTDTEAIINTKPIEPGTYDIYLGFEEGENTLAKEPEVYFTFTIFKLEDSEWEAIQALNDNLATHGYTTGWNIAGGKIAVLRFSGIKIKQGFLAEINMPGKLMTGCVPESLSSFEHLQRVDLSGNLITDIPTTALPQVLYVDLSNNRINGDLKAISDKFPNATTLKVSGNRLSDISAALPECLTSLEYNNQNIDSTVSLDLTSASREALYASLPKITLYDHATRTFKSEIDLWLTTSAYTDIANLAKSTWAMKLTNSDVEKVSENNIYREANGATIKALNDNNCCFNLTLTFRNGDTNFDSTVDVLDLQGALNSIFDEIDNDQPFNYTAADMKSDGTVNVFDVAMIVDMMIKTTANMCMAADGYTGGSASAGSPLAQCHDGKLWINSSEPVASFDITIANATLPSRLPQLDAMGFTYRISNSGVATRIIGYSLTGRTITEGVTEIATVDSGAHVTGAMLSNKKAKAITEPASYSGVDTIGADDDDSENWYNLQGMSISRPTQPGIYIHNNKKIIIK